MSDRTGWIEVRPGDVVRLASGGPPLTIISLDGDSALCRWFDREGRLAESSLPLPCLRPGQLPTPTPAAG